MPFLSPSYLALGFPFHFFRSHLRRKGSIDSDYKIIHRSAWNITPKIQGLAIKPKGQVGITYAKTTFVCVENTKGVCEICIAYCVRANKKILHHSLTAIIICVLIFFSLMPL